MSEIVHYCGQIPGGPADEATLRAALRTLLRSVGAGFGSLAAGGDIAVAEVLLEQGAAVTAVLPFPPDTFLAQSVLPGGVGWAARFEACLRRVKLRVLGEAHTDDLDYALVSTRAMGLARLQARRTAAGCRQIAIYDGAVGSGAVGSGAAGTAADVRRWQAAGGETAVLASPWPRRVRAVVQAPPLRAARALLCAIPAGAAVRVVTPWVPGVYEAKAAASWLARKREVKLVFDDAAEAAQCALALGMDARTGVRRILDWVPVPLDPGAFPQSRQYLAATAPGAVCATEAFACELILRDRSTFEAAFAGDVELGRGIEPTYLISGGA